MRAEYINPFLTAIQNVLKEVIDDIEIERGSLTTKSSPMSTMGCASLINVTGESEGRIMIDMTKETAIKIAEKMNDESFAEFDSMVSSTINELANMVCGGAITIINNEGRDLDISHPTIFVGNNMELYDSSAIDSAVMVPIKTNLGDLYINIAIKDRA